MKFLFALLLTVFAACTPAAAQWQTPNHSVPIGRGAGVTGFGSALPGTAGWALISNGPGTDPTFQAVPGGGNFITVKDFGAKGDGVTNDTAAFQAAIDASCPGHSISVVGNQIFPLWLPQGTYMVSQLNATNCNGFVLWGTGAPSLGPIIQKIAGVSVNAVLDMTGSITGANLKNFYIKSSLGDGDTPYANHGLLLANSNLTAGTGNFNQFENLSIAGRFGVAGMYMYGVCCSTATAIGIQQANPSNGNSSAWTYTNANIGGAISSFVTIATGAQGGSDFACYRCEMHAFTGSSTASGRALVLDGPRGFTYESGILASANAAYTVQLAGNATQVTFINATFYTDQGPIAPFAVGNSSGTVKNILFINPDLTLGVAGALTSFSGSFASGRVINGIININGVVNNFHNGDIGTPPAASACGGSPVVTGTDTGGTVTESGTNTGCTITFATPYPAPPACTFSNNLGVASFASGTTATNLTFAHTSATTLKIAWNCSGP